MCFIIIHKVITITEMKMNYFGKNYFSVRSIICLFRMKQLPGPLIHIHPHPHPHLHFCSCAKYFSPRQWQNFNLHVSLRVSSNFTWRLKFQIFGLGNFKSCDLITKISITIHVSNVHTFKKGSAITQNPNVWESYHIR